MFEEQALLLGDELHLNAVPDQELIQAVSHRERVVWGRLHPQRPQVLGLTELGLWQLCVQADTNKEAMSCRDELNEQKR